ncbi:endonuclease/exonuclease/phosphatase family protein [Allokutzneria sp. A3M-2-11 16]|uniref:endonuclease/exonuclease/phosphatase family protein n=1 Tax=Allokutzneria sp. A3M-2-11 16 TaxID=2962043 RepID=UPI0020B74FDE|nr:endonuclease/exonuclease/phosphatase family protein [Allokutzneria sp. A3M-2-11 16]MCP3805190.1 endonuclease/exonuclease/phosphatase family protein [Allokutzneria sp. A3M-2-11 16]
MRTRQVLSVLAVTLAAGVSLAPAAAAATAVKVLQLNLCHSGLAGCYTGDRVMAKAKEVITSVKPQVLSLNEICSGDVAPLGAAMGQVKSLFVAARSNGNPVKCKNGQDYGNAILVASALAGSSAGAGGIYQNQDAGSEKRSWGCLPGGRVSACTTHLSARDGNVALAQCKELMSRVEGYARTAPALFSGDMNLRYKGNPDAQSCNRTGFYRKGDGALQHVFASTKLAFAKSSTMSMAGTTDHPALIVDLSIP